MSGRPARQASPAEQAARWPFPGDSAHAGPAPCSDTMTYDTVHWWLAAVDSPQATFSTINRVSTASNLKESGDPHYS